MKNISSGGSLASRGDARISVAEKWANRRQQQLNGGNANNQNPTGSLLKRNDHHPTQQPSLPPSIKGGFSIPPLCVLLRRSWNQTINGFIQHPHNTNNKITNNANAQKRSSAPATKQEHNKRVPFPSVLSILKANAVKLQVESMLMEEEEENKNHNFRGKVDGSININDNEHHKKNGNGLSVLPANVNDFATSAVNHMSDSRSRAFLLLDFSAIVQTHTIWRKRLELHKHPNVQMVYSARHNCNARLLRLLQRLRVGVRVTTRYDLAAVREANGNITSQNKKNNTSTRTDRGDGQDQKTMIWDDTSILVKPNSFYRNLLLNHVHVHSQNDDDGENATEKGSRTTIPITVDSTEEMERIHDQLYKICKRRRLQRSNMPKLEFVLRLENNANDLSEWKSILAEMCKKSLELPQTKVVGVALELGVEETVGENTIGFLLDGLSSLVKNWTDGSPPQVHLTNPITAIEIESAVLEWIESHRKVCTAITIDVSRLLMANAAALCARIIGVKNNDDPKKDYARGGMDVNRDENVIRQHLYIDDGCYGSLSNYPNEGIPLPLKSQRFVRSLSATSKQLLEVEQKTLLSTTVWGPTCK
uniref:Uncharacterized protein n=1 Tax=Pseudo-nitzschia australis TaxID=44445 RepID=A0A7S4EPZ3_9STRA|mmetsp:Transcript_10056/g.19862  ORF Transcript_10056/g.19862 Transcript_10056/m.19862 type:complete len:590 (+) Transcript_10056:262-2031(+)